MLYIINHSQTVFSRNFHIVFICLHKFAKILNVAEYLVNDSVPLSCVTTPFGAATREVQMRSFIAADTGTPLRTTTHITTRALLNKVSGTAETSTGIPALSLLGFPTSSY